MKTRNFDKETRIAQERFNHAANNSLADKQWSAKAFLAIIALSLTAKKIRQTSDLNQRKEFIAAFDRTHHRINALIEPVERFIQKRQSLAEYCRHVHTQTIGGTHADISRQKQSFGR